MTPPPPRLPTSAPPSGVAAAFEPNLAVSVGGLLAPPPKSLTEEQIWSEVPQEYLRALTSREYWNETTSGVSGYVFRAFDYQFGELPGGPTSLEAAAPVWGSARDAGFAFREGRYTRGVLSLGLAVSDVFLVKRAVTKAGTLGMKYGGRLFANKLKAEAREEFLVYGAKDHARNLRVLGNKFNEEVAIADAGDFAKLFATKDPIIRFNAHGTNFLPSFGTSVIAFGKGSGKIRFTASEFAEALRGLPSTVVRIELYSCNLGRGSGYFGRGVSFAQELATLTGRTVVAPNGRVLVTKSGKVFVRRSIAFWLTGSANHREWLAAKELWGGSWTKVFTPKGAP